MPSVRVEGIMGHLRVAVEWNDGEVTGDAMLQRAIELAARRAGPRFYEDPLAFAGIASTVVERYSDGPALVTTSGIEDALLDGMAGMAEQSA